LFGKAGTEKIGWLRQDRENGSGEERSEYRERRIAIARRTYAAAHFKRVDDRETERDGRGVEFDVCEQPEKNRRWDGAAALPCERSRKQERRHEYVASCNNGVLERKEEREGERRADDERKWRPEDQQRCRGDGQGTGGPVQAGVCHVHVPAEVKKQMPKAGMSLVPEMGQKDVFERGVSGELPGLRLVSPRFVIRKDGSDEGGIERQGQPLRPTPDACPRLSGDGTREGNRGGHGRYVSLAPA